jgi:CHAD domain-containing protein
MVRDESQNKKSTPRSPKASLRPAARKSPHARLAGEHLRKLTDTLKENLGKCANDPGVDPVHDTRTGTRRIEAALEAELRNNGLSRTDDNSELTQAVRSWERLLKTIRRAAAPVRDLDVQRKLLNNLLPKPDPKFPDPANTIPTDENSLVFQINKLDTALRDERAAPAAILKKNAAKWAAKLDAHLEAFISAPRPPGRKTRPDAARIALDAFARLASQMRLLDAANLHDFRKGAKKARYMAEQGGDDPRAGAVGKALKRLQDEIGDWHDWLTLAEEAHKYLDASGAALTTAIDRKRDLHFETALQMERKMRGRLIGEWLSDTPHCAPSRRPPSPRETAKRA